MSLELASGTVKWGSPDAEIFVAAVGGMIVTVGGTVETATVAKVYNYKMRLTCSVL